MRFRGRVRALHPRRPFTQVTSTGAQNNVIWTAEATIDIGPVFVPAVLRA
jgi:hypothetical protein